MITKEAIRAAADAYWGRDVQHGSTALDQMRIALEAALPFLPIAGEGKVEPRQPDYGYMRVVEVFDRNVTAGAFLSEDGEGGFAAGVSRMADEIDRLRAALISSPGKDGGQEAEAVSGWRWSFDDGDTWHHGPSKPEGHPFGDPDIVEPLYTRPQPASTALKKECARLEAERDRAEEEGDRLHNALAAAEGRLADSTAMVERLRVAIHNALIDGPALANDGQSEFDRAVETILSGVQSALSSSSTSREGESRGTTSADNQDEWNTV